MLDKPFTLDELGNTYVDSDSRYVVSLIVGYTDNDASSPENAVASAIDLTRDENSYSTHWWVYDRETKTSILIEQGQIKAAPVP